MAIVLDVEKYCESCMDFHPDVIAPTRLDTVVVGNKLEHIMSDTIVKCKYRKRCANLVRYLTQQTKE